MPPAARISDMHTCPMVTPGTPPVPHVGGPVVKGEPTVSIGFMPAARVTDQCVCVGPPDVIAKGSPTVIIGYLMAARIGDLTMHGGVIVSGFPQVMIGDAGSGGAGAGGGGGGAGGGAGPGAGGAAAPPANGPFDSPDEAARAALTAANPDSIRDNLEYSGMIYQGTDGKYYYTGPVRGSDQGANPFRDAPNPPGTRAVGSFHTHGDYSTVDPATGAAVRTSDPARDDFNSDNFSGQDKRVHDRKGFPAYLGTPSGTFRKYDPATGSDTVL